MILKSGSLFLHHDVGRLVVAKNQLKLEKSYEVLEMPSVSLSRSKAGKPRSAAPNLCSKARKSIAFDTNDRRIVTGTAAETRDDLGDIYVGSRVYFVFADHFMTTMLGKSLEASRACSLGINKELTQKVGAVVPFALEV